MSKGIIIENDKNFIMKTRVGKKLFRINSEFQRALTSFTEKFTNPLCTVEVQWDLENSKFSLNSFSFLI